jgi:hypothetical protein
LTYNGLGSLSQVIKAWCHAHHNTDSSSSDNAEKLPVPGLLWECLRLDLGEKVFLETLLEDATLALSPAQVADVAKAAVARASVVTKPRLYQYSRNAKAFCITLLRPDDIPESWTVMILDRHDYGGPPR